MGLGNSVNARASAKVTARVGLGTRLCRGKVGIGARASVGRSARARVTEQQCN